MKDCGLAGRRLVPVRSSFRSRVGWGIDNARNERVCGRKMSGRQCRDRSLVTHFFLLLLCDCGCGSD